MEVCCYFQRHYSISFMIIVDYALFLLALSKIHNKSVKPCRVISRTYLQAKESE